MAQLWGGRFEKGTDAMVNEFNASVRFDSRLFLEDVKGSMAHVKMLAKQKILTEEEAQSILVGLKGIADDVADGKLEITSEYEDVHSFVEASLIDRIGEAGKKMHTGRSRNDQVALDMRLYIRDEIDETLNLLKGLLETLESLIEKNTETYMPGFTHMQKAQPVTLAHHLGAYFEMFRRDRERLISVRERMNFCPLGSGALAGTTYPLDREYTAKLLGFSGICRNSMILAMENAGQLIEDEDLREQIKGSGIGTSATRAEILKKLVKIRYLNLNKKTQVITPELLGEMVFDAVSASVKSLLNPELTASWEKGLNYVAEGTITPDDYMVKLENFIKDRVEKVRNIRNEQQLQVQYRRDSDYYPQRKASGK